MLQTCKYNHNQFIQNLSEIFNKSYKYKMYNVQRGKIQKVAFTNCLVASKYRLLFYWMNLRLI